MKSVTAGATALALLSAGPALAGTWACGPGCDIGTMKGVTWTPGNKCPDAQEPEIKTSTAKAYNASAEEVNKWIAKKQEYIKCLSEELNTDFQSSTANMQDGARGSFDTLQKSFSARVEEISKELDDAVKKLNKK